MGSIFALLVPLFVILLAAFTKRIIPSLIIGVLAGGIFLKNGDILDGIVSAIEHLVRAVSDPESVYIIMFLFVFGAFGEIMKLAGGIKGFTKLMDRYVKTERGALASIWLVTPFTFIDCCFHSIASGTIGKALTEKVKGNRYRLAHVINVTSCLLIILIPFGTTYVGYIVGTIASAFRRSGVSGSPYAAYLRSIPFEFYAITMLLISIGVVIFNFGFNRKASAEEGKEHMEEGEHGGHEAHEESEFEKKAPPRIWNLVLPLIFLIASTFFMFWYTGRHKGNSFFSAIMHAQFEKSILISAAVTLVITGLFYVLQRVPMKEMESSFLAGGNEMMPPIIVLVLSWGLASIIQDLGFSSLISGTMGSKIPSFLVPVAIFLIGCAASYFMGSAWGTWALLIPIAVPLAVHLHISMPLIIGAVLAGGSLGDNASPLGETAILSATIAEIPLMEHVKSQLPYSLTAVGISAVLFIVFGLIL